jgi:hypothetical protein
MTEKPARLRRIHSCDAVMIPSVLIQVVPGSFLAFIRFTFHPDISCSDFTSLGLLLAIYFKRIVLYIQIQMINDRHEQANVIATQLEDGVTSVQTESVEPHRKDEESTNEQQSHQKKSAVNILKITWKWISSTYRSNSFLIHIIIVIFLAYLYPPLGAIYFYPQITASWIAVIIIFLLSGLSLKTDDFRRVLKRFHFILFVQSFNFLIVSVIIYGVSRFMIKVVGLQEELGDGLVICSCLPMVSASLLSLFSSTASHN